MAVEYTNRKRVTYYLHKDKTKTGETAYFFSPKAEGNPVDAIPEGYEIYEHPYSQVFLRRIRPQLIAEKEKDLVDGHTEKLTPTRRYMVDVWEKDITLFESNEEIDVLKEVFSQGPPPKGYSVKDVIDITLSFSPALQFTLKDAENRTFIVNRYCFPGATEEWRYIDGPDSLENLANKYIPYLGTDDFHLLF